MTFCLRYVHYPFVQFVRGIYPTPGLTNTGWPKASLHGRFCSIIDELCQAIAAQMVRVSPATRAVLMLVWQRLRRLPARFTRIALRIEAGQPPPQPRPRRNPPPAVATPAAPPDPAPPQPQSEPPPPPRLRTPNTYAWLIRLVPEASGYGGQLQHLLSQPEMQQLLAAAPRAGRIFRPLCRALAAHPHPPLPPPPPRPGKAAKPRRAKARRPKAKHPKPPRARPRAAGAASRPPRPGLASFVLKPVR